MTAQTDGLAQSLFDLAEAVRASAPDPADQIRLLAQMAAYSVPSPQATGTAGQAVAT